MSASVDCYCVSPELLEGFWPHVAPMLRKAMQRGDLGLFSDIERDVFLGKAQLWIGWNGTDIKAAAVTQLHKTESSLSCHIQACGGKDIAEWLPCISTIEKFAKAEGCDRIRIAGRRGWEKLLPGYLPKKVILERLI